MKDELSLFTDAPLPESKTISIGGIIFVSLYLILCACIFIADFASKNKDYSFFGVLIVLGSPTSFIMVALFSVLARQFDDTDLFYISGYPTFRYLLGIYTIAVFGIAVNSFFIFFLGEKFEELFRKRK